MLYHYAILMLGVVCAGLGGEFFVRGSVGLARWFRIAPGIIGATVAAFATSSPELSVSIRAAMAGQPQISLGDAVGSNVVNVALILGIALSISRISTSRNALRRDFPMALIVPVVTGILFLDGLLSRLDGILLLALFAVWLGLSVLEARRQRSVAGEVLASGHGGSAMAACLAGLVLLVMAGGFIVSGARGIAHSYGLQEFIIGATVVAIGTSVPELATTIISKLRGHDEIGLGTVLGSNIFNGLFIVAVAAIICPIRLPWQQAALALGFGLLALTAAFPYRNGVVYRRQGLLLIAIYIAYLVFIFTQHQA